MAKTFDATMKGLVQNNVAEFLTEFDQPPDGPCLLLNVDLSTVSVDADIVVSINDPPTEIIHIEFQASASATKHVDILTYNVLLHRRYTVPVHTIVMLMRPTATHSNLNGEVSYSARPGHGSMNFEYEIIELWQIPVDDLLRSPVGLLPLAPLGRLPEDVARQEALQAVLDRMAERITEETEHDQSVRLLTSAYLLIGLRVNRAEARELFQGVQAMKESETYMMILDEGKEIGREEGREATRELLRIFGEERFGPLDESDAAQLEAIKDLAKLQELAKKVSKVNSWKELFETNGTESSS